MINKEYVKKIYLKCRYNYYVLETFYLKNPASERGYYLNLSLINVQKYYKVEGYTGECLLNNFIFKKAGRYTNNYYHKYYDLIHYNIVSFFRNNIDNFSINELKFFFSWEDCVEFSNKKVEVEPKEILIENNKDDNNFKIKINQAESKKITNGLFLENIILNDNDKKSIEQIINFSLKKELYNDIGAEMPKGILLYGPPGTGKTLIAKTIASEVKANFFNVNGSEFIEKYVGVGPKRIRNLFKKAKENTPCIIFIDEIDAIGCKRDEEANKEANSSLNQLLVELDGFNGLSNITVIGATNRLDILDPALIRPGRFDRKIKLDNPNFENRIKLFKLYINKVKYDKKIDYNLLAEITKEYSGADIKNIVNEAAILAVDNNKKFVTQIEIEEIISNYYKNNKNRLSIGFV